MAACDKAFEECAQSLLVPLARALELVKAGKTTSGRALAVELIGFAQLARLAEQLKFGVADTAEAGRQADVSATGAHIMPSTSQCSAQS